MLASVARRSLKSLTFAPRISRPIGPRPPPAQRRLPHRPVAAQPLPLDPLQLVVGEQPLPPELLEHARLRPLLETAVRRTRGADPGRVQRVPLHPRSQD